KAERQGEAEGDVDIGDGIKAPAEQADEVDDGIEQGHGLPERRQDAERIEGAAEKGERGNDHKGDDLQLLHAPGPDADDEADEAEGYGGEDEEQQHPRSEERRVGKESRSRWSIRIEI